MRLRDLSYRGLAIITGLILLTPNFFKLILNAILVIFVPDRIHWDVTVSIGPITYSPNSLSGYIMSGVVAVIIGLLGVLIFASVLRVLFDKTRLGNIWISRGGEEQMRMKTFN